MSQDFDRSVCASCGKVYNEHIDDADEWHEGPFEDTDEEYDHLCPECYSVIVEGEPETREWLARE